MIITTRTNGLKNIFAIGAALTALLILVSLTIWQLARYEQKKEQLAEATTGLEGQAFLAHSKDYWKQGVFLKTIVELQSTGLPWTLGLDSDNRTTLVQPVKDQFEQYSLLIAGSIPRDLPKDLLKRPIIEGRKQVEVIVRPARGANSFTPETDHALMLMFFEDVSVAALDKEDAALPKVFELENPDRLGLSGAYSLRPITGRITGIEPQKHLHYALTWASLALVLVAMAFFSLNNRQSQGS